MAWISIDIDLYEVYDELRKNDKQQLAEWLYEDGVLENHNDLKIRQIFNKKDSFMEEQHKLNLSKLWDKYSVMSDDDLKLIEELSKKY